MSERWLARIDAYRERWLGKLAMRTENQPFADIMMGKLAPLGIRKHSHYESIDYTPPCLEKNL